VPIPGEDVAKGRALAYAVLMAERGPALSRRVVLQWGAGLMGVPLLAACQPLLQGADPRGPLPQVAGDPGAALSPDTPRLPPDVAALVRQSPVRVTPNERFYVQSYDRIPRVDIHSWRLTVTGRVGRELNLSFEELLQQPSVLVMRTLECIGNPPGGSLIGNAVWRGISFRDLLLRAGVDTDRGVRVVMTGLDGYETSVPLALALRPESLLVYEMNGMPLPIEHGYPLRALFPDRYGQKQPKWLSLIEVTQHDDHRGTWERKGWSDAAMVRVNSRIERPRAGEELLPGPQTIEGVAFAGERAITEVAMIGNGTVLGQAQLIRSPHPLVWTQWAFLWESTEGRWELQARARDANGQVQEAPRRLLEEVFPDGTMAMHRIRLVVREPG
jgi:DMSO/TMAO reductase YedYZ molybdopterin-dependent catalytic subunit